MRAGRSPPLEALLAAAFVVAAGLYAIHERVKTRAEAELEQQRAACLRILAPDQAPENEAQLACRALYRRLEIAQPLPKPI